MKSILGQALPDMEQVRRERLQKKQGTLKDFFSESSSDSGLENTPNVTDNYIAIDND